MTYLKNNEHSELEILTFPHPILTAKSDDIDIMGPNRTEYVKFIIKMLDLYKTGGKWGKMVGIAAPQVGKNWNVFVALGEAYINPKMEIDKLRGVSTLQEGCYSLEKDKFDYTVKRAYKVRLNWLDINGESHKANFYGREAQVIQHEMDHLQGLCCLDGGTKEFEYHGK